MQTLIALKILVIEDDHDVQHGLVQTLSEEGFAVDAVDNGSEGLYRAQEWDYDVIVLDVMLPEMSGWQILEKLRRQKTTPVLMLTALNDVDDRVKGLNSGADDYLAKPYNDRELLARIRALSRRSVGLAENQIDLGRVFIDIADRTVFLDNEPVKLTAAQYKIVAYMARHAGKVVSRNELTEAISGDGEEALSNVIDVQVHHIRRKLGKDFLQNRRGLGYIVPKQ
ncbi:response regulator transcription factor [Cerasicoccus fimbriatus]|uniref:response regulator transcription factor n=1 Tax=Cerasicoccus fimbriatus TaxID=3014554 RepID=UPI0022B4B7CB|nr:response regulator transcription factor [Cerasicoccus sp. TK19100]